MTLLDAVRIARRFWMTIAACVLVGIGAAAAYAASQPRLYTATSEAYVTVGSGDAGISETSVSSSVAAQKASAYAPLTQSGQVADKVVEALGLTEPAGAVTGSISYAVDPSSPRIQMFVTSTSPQKAKDIANVVAAATAEVASVIESGGQADSGTVRLVPVTNAVLPARPSSPDTKRLLLIGLAAGLALAYVVVLVRLRLDTRIRRPEDITGLTDIGLIGTIPKSRDLHSRLHSEDLLRGAVGESLRHLRTNLMFADPDTAPRSVVVTSPQPAEGKSTVSALLARALALRGGKVVLIDGDLRRPMVATLFDIDPGIGLTQVLSGAVPLDEALVETDTVGLLVLPAGRIPHNPSEVVGSERMRDLIAELSSDHLVVIDAPPALPVTDAMILAQRVDGIIVITFMAKSRKEHLKKVLNFAHGVNVRVFGIVLNGIPQGRAAGVYGYETYGYASDDRRVRQQKKRRRTGASARPAGSATVDADPEDPEQGLDTSLDLLSQREGQSGEPVPGDVVVGDPSSDGDVPDGIETAPPRPSQARTKG